MSDAWLTEEQLAELLKEAKVDPGRLRPEMLAALVEIKQRRSWGRTAVPPPRPAQFSEPTQAWARTALTHDIQNLYDDPYGTVAGDAGASREVAVLEEWELLEAVGVELGVEDIAAVAAKSTTEYERDRMEKILVSARWARSQMAAEIVEPEELEAL